MNSNLESYQSECIELRRQKDELMVTFAGKGTRITNQSAHFICCETKANHIETKQATTAKPQKKY